MAVLTPTPFVTPDPKQIELLNQLHSHNIPVLNTIILSLLLSFPLPQSLFPMESRLQLYYGLTAHIPQSDPATSHPFLITSVIIFWPVWIMIGLTLLYFLTKALLSLFRTLTPLILSRFLKEESKTFLELTFPSDTSKSAYATEQLYTLLHTLARQQSFFAGLLQEKKEYALEIVSTKQGGIRYILVASEKYKDVIKRNLLSFLPGIKIKEVTDYLPDASDSIEGNSLGLVELKLAGHFALPLQNLKVLSEHDPISYLTGNMTKLSANDLISFQVVTTPVSNGIHAKKINEMKIFRHHMYKGLPLTPLLQKNPIDKVVSLPGINILWFMVKTGFSIFAFTLKFAFSMAMGVIDSSGKSVPFLMAPPVVMQQEILNPYEQELRTIVKEKIDQHLFETSIRLLVVADDKEELMMRIAGLTASFGPMSSAYQSLVTKGTLPFISTFKSRFTQFKDRRLSRSGSFNQNPILSSSEITDLYHFPYTDITKTEGLVKSRSRELPAPLSLKNTDTNFDVVIGVNQYGGEISPIGLTLEQRQKHMYVIGKTGMGKTTLLTSSIYQDMINGKGLAVFDPHGDMIRELLMIIPKNRRKDVIFFDPSDREWPIGLNLLSPGITFSNEEDGQEWITSSVLAVFKKLADEKYWGPRMEHILRNATLTALLTPNPNLYTLQRLLTDKSYQKKIALTLKDPILKQFWQKEFALMGNMQLSSVTAPLTQRLGYFISSKMSRHILLQQKSTISISEIMDTGKILLVNLSKGDLGEDQSFFFGTILTSCIWMAAYQRTKIPESKRRDFFLYVDEFQNFATPRFSEITSEGRKFHVSLIASHQNIAQVKDQDILKVVVGNANTIVCLKASPDDEQFILPFMDPEVEKGDIVNLSPFNFFMKVTTDESEDAFSGKTVPLDVTSSEKIKDEIIAYTRKHYAVPRAKVEQYLEKLFAGEPNKTAKIKETQPNIALMKPSMSVRKTTKMIIKKGI